MDLKKVAIAAVTTAFVLSASVAMAKSVTDPRAPASAKGEANPVSVDAESVSFGEELYQDLGCGGCHGDAGTGDGAGAAGMDPAPRDFTDGSWQKARADGELKYTIFNGSDGTGMIPNEAMFDEPEDVWHVVNYLRSLGH